MTFEAENHPNKYCRVISYKKGYNIISVCKQGTIELITVKIPGVALQECKMDERIQSRPSLHRKSLLTYVKKYVMETTPCNLCTDKACDSGTTCNIQKTLQWRKAEWNEYITTLSMT